MSADAEVHADDTDVALMLVHHWNPTMHEIIFCSHQSRKSWSVKESALALSPDIKASLLLIHAFSGCDTTSALYGISKATVLKKFKGSNISYIDVKNIMSCILF